MQYAVELEREQDGRWIAEVPGLAGTLSYGASREEALAKVEALALRVLAERLERGEHEPDRFSVTFQAAWVNGLPHVAFAFHDSDEIGPRMLARIAKHTGLRPEDL